MKRHALTLVEILITITIIGILGLASAQVYRSARNSANERNSAALIQRINSVVMQKYGSYNSRRIPMNTTHFSNPRQAAVFRVNARRELAQMEMPDRFSELPKGTGPVPPVYQTPHFLSRVPSLSERYRRIYNVALSKAGGDHSRLADNAAAECLYMIVMSIPDAAEQFSAKDFGDVDQDGLPEFHDAWGKPIRWLRWPAGFIPANKAESDLHTGVFYDTSKPETQPDPFDPQGLLAVQGEFPLYPLIYSAGPDKDYDICIGKDNADIVLRYPYDSDGNLNPFGPPTDGSTTFDFIGQPLNNDPSNPNGDLRHFDNITNHRL